MLLNILKCISMFIILPLTYYTFFFNVDAVICQNNGQFQVWELNIWKFIVIVEIKYFLNLNE
jgi:hypothetical protein